MVSWQASGIRSTFKPTGWSPIECRGPNVRRFPLCLPTLEESPVTTRVTLHSLPDGQVVVEKVALDGDLADRKAEAQWLAVARDPGVVQLVAVTEDPFTITSAHAGATTLRTDHLPPEVAAAILSSACDTLARLHERNIAHGKLTLDHVVLSPEGDAVLCSPDGNAADPVHDLVDLGKMAGELAARWKAAGEEIPNEAQWLSLAERLASEATVLTARRAARAFARLGPARVSPLTPLPAPRRTGLRPRAISFGALTLGAIAVLVLVAAGAGRTSPVAIGVEISIGPDLYSVGQSGDVVLAVPNPCPGQPRAVLLDRHWVVWAFNSASDGAVAQPLVQIPGATDLSITTDDGCSQVWASGPAGQTQIVGS